MSQGDPIYVCACVSFVYIKRFHIISRMLYIYAKGHHLGELGTASSTLTVIIVWNEGLCSVAKREDSKMNSPTIRNIKGYFIPSS